MWLHQLTHVTRNYTVLPTSLNNRTPFLRNPPYHFNTTRDSNFNSSHFTLYHFNLPYVHLSDNLRSGKQNIDYKKQSYKLTISFQTEPVRQVTTQFSKVAYCRNLTVVAAHTAFMLTLWDNAAVYTTVDIGDRIQVNDVKLGKRDNTPMLIARFSDQIQVTI